MSFSDVDVIEPPELEVAIVSNIRENVQIQLILYHLRL